MFPPRGATHRTVGRACGSGLLASALIAGCGGSGGKSATTAATVTRTKTATSTRLPNADPLATLVAAKQDGIIRIETTTCSGGEIGTGFIIGPRLIATVEHVVDGATAVELKRNGRVLGTGVVIGEDATRDVALVRSSAPISGRSCGSASRSPRLGESVAALGFPLGLPLTVTQGAVSGLARTIPIGGIERRDLVQTDAALNRGNSGGR